MQIVPRQSATLREFPDANIHQNHSDITKFSGETDTGYTRVPDQMWLFNLARPLQSRSFFSIDPFSANLSIVSDFRAHQKHGNLARPSLDLPMDGASAT